jgi:hypothetical protein
MFLQVATERHYNRFPLDFLCGGVTGLKYISSFLFCYFFCTVNLLGTFFGLKDYVCCFLGKYLNRFCYLSY